MLTTSPVRCRFGLGAILFVCACNPPAITQEWTPSDHSSSWTATENAPADNAAVDLGASLYRARCASCHGEAGAGGGPGMPPVAPRIDLRATTLSEAEAAQVIARGRGGFMPAFEAQIPQTGIQALASYVVRELGHRPPPTASAPSETAEAAQ